MLNAISNVDKLMLTIDIDRYDMKELNSIIY